MAVTVHIRPNVLKWARERAALESDELARRVGLKPRRVVEWEQTGRLSLVHLERVAEKTHTPIGFLFSAEPPELRLPIADFRSQSAGEPSPELLDTIFTCEQRQAWYRENVIRANDPRLTFVGSVRTNDTPTNVARRIRAVLGLDLVQRAQMPTWAEALRDLYERTEDAGILVMRNGVVGNNTHRPLDVREFRGFTLSDALAPLIFVNAADSKAAQMFTVAHELAHVWRGDSGVSDVAIGSRNRIERFCNQVATELLVPLEEFTRSWRTDADHASEAQRLARQFKVSSLVILIRAHEAQKLTTDQFSALYDSELGRLASVRSGNGGDFYRTQRSRLGRRFASAVIASTLEGDTSYTDAFRLLGIRKVETFTELGRSLGVLQ